MSNFRYLFAFSGPLAVVALACLGIGLGASSVAAQDGAQAPVELRLEPWNSRDGQDRPYRYVVTLTAREEVELAADRRLLFLELRPIPAPEAEPTGGRRRRRARRPRVVRCTHPNAPSRPPESRLRTLAAGQSYAEWIDLRMLCWGRSLSTLAAGAEVTPRFGYRTGSRRTRWAYRAPNARQGERSVDGAAFQFAAQGAAPASAEGSEAPPITVTLSAAQGTAGSSPTFRAGVRAEGEARRVYLRADSFAFAIEGPLGGVDCSLPIHRGRPTSDLFTRLARGRSRTFGLASGDFCPRDTFEVPGIYTVTPRVVLIQSGSEWGFEAVTGAFTGAPQPLRVRASRRGPYLEHPVPGAEGLAGGDS